MVKTKGEDFKKWLWHTLIIKMFGRTFSQILLSIALSVGFLALGIVRIVYELPLLGDSSDWVKFSFSLVALCLFSMFLGNSALTNHELVSRPSQPHMSCID